MLMKSYFHNFAMVPLREKCSSTEYLLVRIFVFSPNTGKYGPKNTPYMDTFHAVFVCHFCMIRTNRKISIHFTVNNLCQRFVFKYLQLDHYRSSHQRCSIKKVLLKNFAIFTGKHLCWRLFFLESTLFKRDSNTGVFL